MSQPSFRNRLLSRWNPSWEVHEYINDYEEIEETEDERLTIEKITDSINQIFNGHKFMIRRARRIQQENPRKLLCGSLALILYEAIPDRSVGDLDFVMMEKRIVPNETICLKLESPSKHCLFLSSSPRKGKTIEGLHLQDLEQIIHWKRRYGRKKDLRDLERKYGNEFIEERDFKL